MKDNKTFLHYFKEQVNQTPDQIALNDCENATWTYNQVDAYSNKVTEELLKCNVCKGDIVAVLLERRARFPVAVLGVFKAGAAYLPIDANASTGRIGFILADSQAKVLITSRSMDYLTSDFTGVRLYIEEQFEATIKETGHKVVKDIPIIIDGDDISHIIYTSGTTGVPKGTINYHRGISNLIDAYVQGFQVTSEDISGVFSNFSFDASIMQIMVFLAVGAVVDIMPDNVQKDIMALESYINDHRITITCMPPMIVKLFDENCQKETTLRCVIAGGDKLFFRTKGNYILYNAYGPTETCVMSSYFLVDKDYDNIPIGKPLPNINYYIVDENGQEVAEGREGELYIGGVCVGAGYLNRQELTTEKFVVNAFSKNQNQEVLYRTGDLCKKLPDGNYVFLGRIDTQVKIYGYRIELGEIEAAMRSVSGVDDAVCSDFIHEDGKHYIAGFYTGIKALDAQYLKAALEKKLPRYMIPTVFEKIEAIPQSSQGKYDRKALIQPENLKMQGVYRQPQTKMEKVLLETISELSLEIVPDFESSFSEVGGDSISAIRLVEALRKKGYQLRSYEILDTESTLEQLARMIQSISSEASILGEKSVSLEKSVWPEIKEKIGELEEVFDLTPTQRGMLYYYIRNPKTRLYLDQVVYKIDGDFDLNLCRKAFAVLEQKYPVLKTSILHEEEVYPKQRIVSTRTLEIKGIVLNDQEDFNKVLERDMTRGFDLEQDELFRITIMKADEACHYLLLSFAHIILDGWSIGNLLIDFKNTYCRLQEGEKQLELETEARKWAEQRKSCFEFVDALSKLDMNPAFDYYGDMLKGYETNGRIIHDYKINKEDIKHTEKVKKLPRELVNGITRIAARYKLTISTVYEGIYGLALQKYCGSNDVVFGKTTSGRNLEFDGIENMVGLFINTLPARIETNPEDSFAAFFQRVQKRVNQDRKYDYADLSGIQKNTVQRDELLQTLFSFNQFPQVNQTNDDSQVIQLNKKGGLKLTPFKEVETTHYNMAFIVNPGDEVSLVLRYNERAYSANTMEDFLELYQYLIEQAVENMEMPVKEATLLPEEKQKELIERCQGPVDDAWKDATYIGLFKTAVSNMPEAIAIKDCYEKQLTYGELDRVTDKLAWEIKRIAGDDNAPIGIMVNRSVIFPIAALSVFKAGRAYLPINSEYPEEILHYMVADAGASVMLTCDEFETDALELCDTIVNLSNWKEYLSWNEEFVYTGKAEDMAYMIYTSGSTGKPKGTMLSVKNLVNLCKWSIFRFGENLITAATSGFSFDVSLEQIFPKLISGGKVIIVNEAIRDDMEELENLVEHEQVNSIHMSTALARIFMDHYGGSSLKCLAAAGEKLITDWVPKTYALYNLYGPTEYTVISTEFLVDHVYDNIPIGKPVHNTWGYILDDNLKMVPRGALGQLCLSGRQMSAGYRNKPEISEKQFVRNPFAQNEDTNVLYKTGDLARLLPDGSIEFHGRMDTQVKIRGFRIELGAVEQVMGGYEGIKEVVVHAAQDENEPYICCYYTARDAMDEIKMKEYAACYLPEYMVPQVYVWMDKIPLTPNGKVDKKALPKAKRNCEVSYEPPQNEMEQKLEEVFCAVLNMTQFSREANFFDMGGTSLSAIGAVARLKAFYRVDMNKLYENPTIKKLAEKLTPQEKKQKARLENAKTVEPAKIAETVKKIEAKKACYLEDIKSIDTIDLNVKSEYKTVLLTGATGYLGAYLLKEMLEHYDYKIVAIIRGKDKEEAVGRLLEKTSYYFNDKQLSPRIEVLSGDVSEERLGLSSEEYARLSKEIDLVVNAAADVRHFGHYEQFLAANVVAVERLLELCTLGRKKDFVQTSTTSVGMGNIVDSHYAIFTEDDLDMGQDFDNYYIKTKQEAERITILAREKGIDTTIFRLGNICVSTQSHTLQANIQENAFYKVLEGFINLSLLSSNYAQAELSFVDQCADGICRLMNCKNLKNATYHIQNHQVADIAELLTRDGDLTLQIVEDHEFTQFLSANSQREDVGTYVENIVTHLDALNDDITTYTEVLTEKTAAILKRLGFSWHVTTKECLMPLVHKALENRVSFLKSLPYLEGLAEEEWYALAGLMKSRMYEEDEFILHENKKYREMMLIRSGMAHTFMTSKSGWEGELEIVKKGELVGMESYLGEKSSLTLESMFDSLSAFVIDTKQLEITCKRYPGIGKALLRFTNEKLVKIRSLWVNVE